MATDDKYDRQLRLWGASGQAALMGAHVLLGAEPTGSETLKNLVLPGLGLVAVVDGGNVTSSDLASTSSSSPPRSAASAPTSTSSCSAR
jgi:amyloid beta precursor protein binding protein 1